MDDKQLKGIGGSTLKKVDGNWTEEDLNEEDNSIEVGSSSYSSSNSSNSSSSSRGVGGGGSPPSPPSLNCFSLSSMLLSFIEKGKKDLNNQQMAEAARKAITSLEKNRELVVKLPHIEKNSKKLENSKTFDCEEANSEYIDAVTHLFPKLPDKIHKVLLKSDEITNLDNLYYMIYWDTENHCRIPEMKTVADGCVQFVKRYHEKLGYKRVRNENSKVIYKRYATADTSILSSWGGTDAYS